jgi:lipopolysaccharide export system permease protein
LLRAFLFDDNIVIPTLKMKNNLSEILLRQQRSDFQADIVIRARQGRLTYTVDFFDTANQNLYGISIVEQDENGRLISLIRAHQASWNGRNWVFSNAIIYDWNDGFLQFRNFEGSDEYREEPDMFRRNLVNVEELRFLDAQLLARDLRTAGLPYLDALANFHHRFSFATACFVVTILSISMGGRFRKNILLMSLGSSIGAAVFFYVIEMITMMMARLGYFHPFIGAWFPVFIFIAIGALLLKTAKT